MPYNYARVQLRAHQLITKYGRKGVLRRSTGDRNVTCVVINETSSDREGSLTQFVLPTALVSAKGLTVPPDQEEDVLVVGATVEFVAPFTTYHIIAPPTKLDPAGTVVYWELQVRK